MISGIHAIGGIGRSISKIGSTTALKVLLQPRPTPSPTPRTIAKKNAIRTRLKLTQICTGRIACEIGFVIMFRNFSQVASGVGIILFSALDNHTHARIKIPIETTGST